MDDAGVQKCQVIQGIYSRNMFANCIPKLYSKWEWSVYSNNTHYHRPIPSMSATKLFVNMSPVWIVIQKHLYLNLTPQYLILEILTGWVLKLEHRPFSWMIFLKNSHRFSTRDSHISSTIFPDIFLHYPMIYIFPYIYHIPSGKLT